MKGAHEKECGWNWPDDLNEAAWALIANAWDGEWSKAGEDWRATATAWRDAYHETLKDTGLYASSTGRTEVDDDQGLTFAG
jgi:hypothetical protein